jgi:DNA polymerase elongation subunit (family B)
MTLNVSPETKVGHVHEWNLEQHMAKKIEKYELEVNGQSYTFTYDQFMEFMEHMKFTLSSNGILYMTDKMGVIPEILDRWFKQRAEYKELLKKANREGNKELEGYYDRRQHVQKIFLNSIYGVLGLPIFRFYDLDNALAVTATGQDVIKTSAKIINNWYKTETKEDKDQCIYIDTDSLYFSSNPLSPTLEAAKYATPWGFCAFIARRAAEKLNKSYETMTKRLFFVQSGNRLVIKGEKVASTAFWTTKKRYALWTVYDLGLEEAKEKLVIKGLDVVRSSFPPAFAAFLKQTLVDILHLKPKEELDKDIQQFVEDLPNRNYLEIARTTSISNGLAKYDDKHEKSLLRFPKGTPAHVKAAITYNRWLKEKNWDRKHELIRDGSKIKYVYLKRNPLGIDSLAVKGYDDPKELVQFVKEYIDYKKLFDNELKSKLEDFYKALGWGNIPTEINQFASEFFDF